MEPPARYSLVHKDVAARTYDVHRLVQAVMRETMDKDTQRLWAERVVKAVNLAFPFVDLSTWPLCERLLPHAQVCAELITRWGFEIKEAARLLNQAGYYLHERARYTEAEPLYVRSLGISEKVLGPEHPSVAVVLRNMTENYAQMKREGEAERCRQRARSIEQRKDR